MPYQDTPEIPWGENFHFWLGLNCVHLNTYVMECGRVQIPLLDSKVGRGSYASIIPILASSTRNPICLEHHVAHLKILLDHLLSEMIPKRQSSVVFVMFPGKVDSTRTPNTNAVSTDRNVETLSWYLN